MGKEFDSVYKPVRHIQAKVKLEFIENTKMMIGEIAETLGKYAKKGVSKGGSQGQEGK